MSQALEATVPVII